MEKDKELLGILDCKTSLLLSKVWGVYAPLVTESVVWAVHDYSYHDLWLTGNRK